MEDFNISQGMYKILKQAIFPIVGNMFHPTYLMINTSILGKIQPDASCPKESKVYSSLDDVDWKCITAKEYVAAFGLGSSYLGIILLASGFCYTGALSTLVPQAFGAGNYKLIGIYMNRIRILFVVIFLPICLSL